MKKKLLPLSILLQLSVHRNRKEEEEEEEEVVMVVEVKKTEHYPSSPIL